MIVLGQYVYMPSICQLRHILRVDMLQEREEVPRCHVPGDLANEKDPSCKTSRNWKWLCARKKVSLLSHRIFQELRDISIQKDRDVSIIRLPTQFL
jgi:hypothetical protein